METTLTNVRQCGDSDIRAGREALQLGWYEFARGYIKGKRVLDVGCGLGKGLSILRSAAAIVQGQDLDPRLAGPDVFIMPVEQIPDKSYDVVTSMDVIEHIKDAEAFLSQLVRIAREGILLTTPNWAISRCEWHYHFREYMPNEFYNIVAPYGQLILLKGTSRGDTVYPVRHRTAYFAFNKLRTWKPTSFLTRCVNFALPSPYKIYSHIGAWIRLN